MIKKNKGHNRKNFLILILGVAFIFLAGCAGTPVKQIKQLTVAEIVSSDMKEIDLLSNQLVCTGKKKESLDQVEGAVVMGILCEEQEHMSFLYLFNGEPFFFAIMGINQKRDELTPLRGFGAMKSRDLMLPVDFNSKPRLPVWAYGQDGKPIESIYRMPGQPAPEPPRDIR